MKGVTKNKNQKMLLKKIQIENLRSYKKQEIDFPKGSTLLSGDIGSGKTTILLAVEFALFGLQPSQRGNSLLRNGEDTGKVILEFEVENKQIIIERTLKRGKKSISQDYCSLIIDDEKFEGSVTEVKSKVLTLLNYPREFAKKTNLLYKFTVYTPQEEMKQIILESGDTRLNTLRHVFGIDKYKKVQENTSLLTSKLREKIRTSEGMIHDLEEDNKQIEQKKQELIELKQKQIDFSRQYERITTFRNEKEKRLNEVQEKIEEKKALESEKSKSDLLISEKNQQIATLTNNLKTLNQQIQEAKKLKFNEEEFNSLNQRIKFQEEKEETLQKEYIEVISQVNSNDAKKAETEQLKNKIKNLERCPTCLQDVSDTYKNNISVKINQEIELLNKIINELNIKKNKLAEEINIVKKTKEDFKSKKSELELLKVKLENLKEKEQRILEIDKQKSIIQKDLEMIEKHLLTIQKTIEDYEKYDKIYEERNKELQDAKAKENEAVIRQAELNKEIQFSKQRIAEIKKQIEKKQEIKKQTEKLKELEYWISEKFMEIVLFTEKQVMIALKEEFSRLFSKWFSILVSESLSAKLADDFSPITEQQDYELDYSFLSGGERTAIALAYRLSLNQVINSLLSNIKTSNLVILDEPTDGFSAQQLDKMGDVLNQLNVEQLILVSHETKIEGFVDNIIRIRKEGGVSNIN